MICGQTSYNLGVIVDHAGTTAEEAREMAKKHFPDMFRCETSIDPLDMFRCIEDPIWRNRRRCGDRRNYEDVVCEALMNRVRDVRAGAQSPGE